MDAPHIDDEPTTRRRRPNVPLRVLLAEDDDEMRGLLAASLRLDGHDVTEARDGLELAARTGPGPDGARSYDVIVSDVLMPGATGITVLTRVSHDPCAPWMVAITAFGGEELTQWAHSIGVLATFDKPFDVDDLRTVLMNLAPKRR